jgi:phage shock protein E
MTKYRSFLLQLGFVLIAASCSNTEPPAPTAKPASTAKNPQAARELIASGAVVIDVRTPEEYADGHLPNAVNIPIQEMSSHIGDVEKLVGNDRARPVVVYCAAGSRAAKAKTQLDAAGFSHVVNGGGLDDLR